MKRPTVRESKLADVVIENATSDKGMTAKQMLVKAGYDETTAEATPGRVLRQSGVRQALIEKGFTVDRADEVVTEILNTGEEKNRLKAAEMVYKRHPGALQPETPPPSHQVNFFITNPKARQALQDFESALIEQMYVQTPQEASPALEAGERPESGDGS